MKARATDRRAVVELTWQVEERRERQREETKTRARWRGGTEETNSEIESAKERVSHTERGGGIYLSYFMSLSVFCFLGK